MSEKIAKTPWNIPYHEVYKVVAAALVIAWHKMCIRDRADAPCSGQSLLAKGIPNPGCFNSSVTGGNAKRQRGILLAALRCPVSYTHLVKAF